jgi:hypothetical protein
MPALTIPEALDYTRNALREGNFEAARRTVDLILSHEPMHAEALRWRDRLTDMIPLERSMHLVNAMIKEMSRTSQINSLRLYREMLADPQYADPRRLERHGAKFYSQNDEDGIIEEIFRRIGTTNRTFLEFGVENGLENNTLLLTYKGWQGIWMDGSERNIAFIEEKFKPLIAQGRLRALQQWIMPETINALIASFKLPTELDLLSIDIDSYDYYVFEQITTIRPRVVVIEYNAKLPPPIEAVMAYNPARTESGFTDYFGCSLEALTRLANRKGYQLVGCNITGSNAFLVRQDLCHELFYLPATAAALYHPPRYEINYAGAFRVGHPTNYGVWEAR